MMVEVDLRDKDPEYYENRDFIHHALELTTQTRMDVESGTMVREEREACCIVIGDLKLKMTRRQYTMLIEFMTKIPQA